MSGPRLAAPLFASAEHERRFHHDGFVVVDLLDAAALDQLRAAWAEGEHHVSRLPFSSTIMSPDGTYREAVHARVGAVLAPRIRAVVPGHRFCLGSFVAKQPGDSHGRVELHQDWAFVDEERFWSLGFWCPLADVDAVNGCLRALPGSHRVNRGLRGYMQDFAYPELASEIEERYLVDVPMRAGQAFVSTQSLFHASPPNTSASVRVAAAGLVVPRDSQLWFVTGAAEVVAPGHLGVYTVADDFYVTHRWGAVPDPSLRLAAVEASREPLSRERLRSLFGEGAPRASV